MKCPICNDKIDDHHIHPRFMDNSKGNGKQYSIPKTDHIKLHLIIPSIIWKYVEDSKKQECIDEVISFSEKFIENLKNPNIKDLTDNYIKICPDCFYECDIQDEYCNRCDKALEKE